MLVWALSLHFTSSSCPVVFRFKFINRSLICSWWLYNLSIDKVCLQISAFIGRESGRFEDQHNHMFVYSWSAIVRYRDYLNIVLDRYKAASQDFILNLKAQQVLVKPGNHPMTQEQMELAQKGAEISARLHLEIESFYLFAKILLDKVVHAIEFYFGQGRGISLDSHDDLTKGLADYAKLKGLSINSSLGSCMRKCKTEISDYRDYQIAHEKSPRTMRGTMFSLGGSNVRMFSSQIYPRESDKKQIESGTPDVLLQLIDEHIANVLSFVEQNRERVGLNLEKKK